MDFNTGRGSDGPSRDPNDSSASAFGGGQTDPPRPPSGQSAGGSGGEFNLSDPVGSFVRTARGVLLSPASFFRGMARGGNFVNPAVFALICYVIYALLGGLLGLVLGNAFNVLSGAQDTTSVTTSILSFVGGVVLSPLAAAIILGVVSGVRHLLVMLIVGQPNAGFEATLRVSAYTFATRLVWWIPIIGALVGSIYGLVLSVIGIREAHATTTGKAALVVLIPVAIAVVIVAILAALFGALIFTLLQQQA